MDRNEVQFCIFCGARFTAAECECASSCPKCGDSGNPCATDRDVTVRINWQELRVLGIWAEQWAQHCTKQSPDDPGRARPEVIHAITRRLERQMKDKGWPPLTLSGEIMQVRDHGIGIEGYNVAKGSVIPVNGPGAVVETNS